MAQHQRILATLVLSSVISPALLTSSAVAGPVPQRGGETRAATCVALMFPSVKGAPGDVPNAVRDLFASYLTAPAFQTVMLEAKLTALAMDEARAKKCDNVLAVTLTRKAGGGNSLGKLAGQAAGSAAVYVPGSANTGTAIVRGAAVGSAIAVSSLATSTRKKDELKLEFRVQTPDKAMRVGPATHQTKASADGEDLLTPLVERAAMQIADVLLKS